MKAAVYFSAVLTFIVGGGITFAVVRWLGKGSPELAFIGGAVLGTQIAAVVHHRSKGAVSSPGVKAGVGASLALSAIVLGIVMHAIWKPFDYPEISIPMAVAGSFVFPFVLFEQMWNALSKKPGA
jgi:hypothetical protein